jgi:chemotaxis-related protein WspD
MGSVLPATTRHDCGDCWKTIGTGGDGTCPELVEHVHCRNCPTYSERGRSLLDRPPPDGYVDEWRPILAQTKETETGESVSALVFRLGREWIAIRSRFLEEIVPTRTIHSIPHRTNAVLMGLANVRGELLLCVSLAEVLHLAVEEPARQGAAGAVFGRMVVAAHSGGRWVFPVDEVDSIYRFPLSDFETVPVTITKSASTCSRGIFTVDSRRIALLDEDLLFEALKGSLHWQTTT